MCTQKTAVKMTHYLFIGMLCLPRHAPFVGLCYRKQLTWQVLRAAGPRAGLLAPAVGGHEPLPTRAHSPAEHAGRRAARLAGAR